MVKKNIKEYKIKDCFQLNLSEEWNISNTVSLIAHAPRETSGMSVSCLEAKSNKTPENVVAGIVKSCSEKDSSFKEIERKRVTIDNHEAIKFLFSSQELNGTTFYGLFYFVYGEDSQYQIYFYGRYEDFEKDLENIDTVIANFRVLK